MSLVLVNERVASSAKQDWSIDNEAVGPKTHGTGEQRRQRAEEGVGQVCGGLDSMGYEAAATTLEQGKSDGGVDGAGRQTGCVEYCFAAWRQLIISRFIVRRQVFQHVISSNASAGRQICIEQWD
ncbi:hypothetical protein COCCADRAFT_31172 [Bipolaris zeicola 26-R-13]|uniref:Uncharacterized protein n=1 Tax=Cochliobolus carbonum (strain 26-R-13) TaxID=930089 RepID=W6XJJ5_COCC2|nr:uncharacterized protein COCCADRAFT_31172 [Bipolaris zeicola 26-R-13]EUC27327.1 hypothetical protein COCCADRAFT_31172 [Bipolaris zeicola 26-R-13]